jgi:hypothetical protein
MSSRALLLAGSIVMGVALGRAPAAGAEEKAPSMLAPCVRPPADPIARAHWVAPAGELLLTARRTGAEVRSDRLFFVAEAELVFVPAGARRCVSAHVALGEVTLPGPPPDDAPDADVPARMETLHLAGPRPDIALVWLIREVAFGRTEEYVVAVDVSAGRLVASKRVLARLDSMDLKGFSSVVRALDADAGPAGAVLVEREGTVGPGKAAKRVVLRRAVDGTFTVEER